MNGSTKKDFDPELDFDIIFTSPISGRKRNVSISKKTSLSKEKKSFVETPVLKKKRSRTNSFPKEITNSVAALKTKKAINDSFVENKSEIVKTRNASKFLSDEFETKPLTFFNYKRTNSESQNEAKPLSFKKQYSEFQSSPHLELPNDNKKLNLKLTIFEYSSLKENAVPKSPENSKASAKLGSVTPVTMNKLERKETKNSLVTPEKKISSETISKTVDQCSSDGKEVNGNWKEDLNSFSSLVVCFICGNNLSSKNLQYRVNHIKKCGRENDHFKAGSLIFPKNPRDDPNLIVKYLSKEDQVKNVGMMEYRKKSIEIWNSYVSKWRHILEGNMNRFRYKSGTRSDYNSKNAPMLRVLSDPNVTIRGLATENKKNNEGIKRKQTKMSTSFSYGSKHSRGFIRHSQRPLESYKFIPNTNPPFVVDGFKGDSGSSVSFFLSHFHSDHYQGLNKGWRKGTIYCSEVTAALLLKSYPVHRFVKSMPLNERFVIQNVGVTLLDANHCPGAVMFLFDIPKKNTSLSSSSILNKNNNDNLTEVLSEEAKHEEKSKNKESSQNGKDDNLENDSEKVYHIHCGDFRFDPIMCENEHLKKAVGKTECLLLDTTYSKPQYQFPPQDVCIEFVIKKIAEAIAKDKEMKRKQTLLPCAPKWSSSSSNVLFLIGTYSIGKERILFEIFRRFGKKIGVSSQQFQRLRVMDLFNPTKHDLIHKLMKRRNLNNNNDSNSSSKEKVENTIKNSEANLEKKSHFVEPNPLDDSEKLIIKGDNKSVIEHKDADEWLSQLTINDVFTTKLEETDIHVVSMRWINQKSLASYLIEHGRKHRPYESIVGFSPTGWSGNEPNSREVKKGGLNSITIHRVPYSEHSSYSELQEFVKFIKPKKIIPTVPNTTFEIEH